MNFYLFICFVFGVGSFHSSLLARSTKVRQGGGLAAFSRCEIWNLSFFVFYFGVGVTHSSLLHVHDRECVERKELQRQGGLVGFLGFEI